MKSIEGNFLDGESINRKVVINYDFSTEGNIEIRANNVTIPIPGEIVEKFISAYLSDRQIQNLILKPIGYDK